MFEQFENLYALAINVVGLVAALLLHIRKPRFAWVCVIVFLLGNLLSNYYWGAYTLLMGDYPNVSSALAYFGWNVSYVPPVLLLLHMRQEPEKRFFHPLCLLPVPLNIAQFLLYIQYGGLFNNIWQGGLCTAIACLSLNSLLCWRKNRAKGMKKPYVSFALFLFVIFEYTMWTASCFSWPSEWLYPYNYASILNATFPLLLIRAIRKSYPETGKQKEQNLFDRPRSLLPPLYIATTLVCCVGGYLLALWMRGVLTKSLSGSSDTDPYSIIAVVLFLISCVLVFFSVAIVMLVRFWQKTAESDALRQAKAVAEHSNAAKSDFLANMSHEIRTPINAVLGMNEMILRESMQARDLLPREREAVRRVFADICQYAGNIESAGSSLLSLINDILDFSKIEAGKLELKEGPYKFSSVLNDVSNMIAFRARDKGLVFRVDADPGLPDGLYGDELRVRQIVTNLLNNAVKYTRKGSIVLSVRGELSEAEDEVALTISVSDTGIGIRPEDIGKLFQKFQRVDLQKNSTVEGTGLGLAITYSLLEMMGGSIEVESSYGEGSTFTAKLRQKVVSTEAVGNFQDKFRKSVLAAEVYHESFRAPEAHILIVDDTRMNLTVAANLLKNTEIGIDTAISGEEAIALCRSIPYDLILMDQRMPEMDGTEAMRLIRAQEDGVNRVTPFICLTADAVSGARERYLAEGFTDYLSKPIDSKALEQTLAKYLPAQKVQRRTETEAAVPADSFAEDEWEPLRAAGIDPEASLRYCQNDAALCRAMMEEYARAADEKGPQMERYYAARDWKNYAILVHAVKSSSRMLGAETLADLAAGLESAANSEDDAAVEKNHAQMMALYRAAAAAIRLVFAPEGGEPSDEDEIMEFIPE